MNLFRPLFADWRTAFYTVALGLMVATLFVARVHPDWPLNAIAIVLLGMAWITEGQFGSKFKRLQHPAYLLPVLLYIMYIIGIFYSENQDAGWRMAEHKMSLIFAPLFIAASASFKKQHAAWAMIVFVGSAFAAMMIAFLLAFIQGLNLPPEVTWIDRLTYQRLSTVIAFQPIYLSFYLVFAFFATLALCHMPRFQGQLLYKRKSRAYALMAFFFVSIVMLSSRMELIVLFATSGLLILCFAGSWSKQWKYWAVLAGFILLASGIIFSSAENRLRFAEMMDFSADYTENQYGGRSIRVEKWKNTVETWSSNWLLGVGTGDVQDELNRTYEKNQFEIAREFSFNPHNQYLETALAIGIPGLLILVFWMAGHIVWGFRKKNWLLFAFGIVVAFSILTESMLERHWGVVFIAFFSMILLRDNFDYFSDQPQSEE